MLVWELLFPTERNTLSLGEIFLGSYYTLLGSKRTLGIYLAGGSLGTAPVLAVLQKLAKNHRKKADHPTTC